VNGTLVAAGIHVVDGEITTLIPMNGFGQSSL